jgi:hypothetical protein
VPRIGIEGVFSSVQDAVTATVNLYRSTGCLIGNPNTGNNTQIASTQFVLIPSMNRTVVPVTLDTMGAKIGVNEVVLIEWILPATSPLPGTFPGANQAGQTAPGFIKAPGCNVPNYVDFAGAFGFPNRNLVLSLTTVAATSAPSLSPSTSASPSSSPSTSSSPTASCDQECNGKQNHTPMHTITKWKKCLSACIPDKVVNRKLRLGWDCGVCPPK